MNEFLAFEGVSKSFDDLLAVDGVSLGIEEGEIFALLGPSGCGKTTLLRMLAGFIEPDDGRILIEGKNIAALPPEKRPVNTVFQNYALFPHLSLRDNIAFGLKMAGRRAAEIDGEVRKMLALVDLEAHADKKPAQISGGQKQRVAIARALINRPRVLLLDEPLAALDLKLRQRLLVELDHLHDEVGITFLYVTHDQTEAMAISDRIGILNRGKLQQVGSPPEIYESPVNSFVAAFIGDTNFVRGEVVEVRDAEYSVVESGPLGRLVVYNDREIRTGETVDISLRPEKLRIWGDRPDDLGLEWNLLDGEVEDVIYLGNMTRYRIRGPGDLRFIVERQHTRFLLDESPPTCEDRVTIGWSADDGFLLRDFSRPDRAMISLPTVEADLA